MFPAYLEGLDFLPEKDKKEFKEFCVRKLGEVQRNARQTSVDNSEYKGTNLSVATNEGGLYNFIARSSNNLPTLDDFKREFKRAIKYVKQFKVEKSIKEKAD